MAGVFERVAVYLPEEAGMNQGIYYDGRIYVYDEDTYLVSVTHSEIILSSDSIRIEEWENSYGDKVQGIAICYNDNVGMSAYPLRSLIQPDYCDISNSSAFN